MATLCENTFPSRTPIATRQIPWSSIRAQTAPPAVVVEGDGSDSEPKKKSVSVEELGALVQAVQMVVCEEEFERSRARP